MKYIVNKNCIGCGLCVSICPEVFHMTDEGVSEAKSTVPPGAENSAKQAMQDCPVSAIEET